jgi:hypothetical protein
MESFAWLQASSASRHCRSSLSAWTNVGKSRETILEQEAVVNIDIDAVGRTFFCAWLSTLNRTPPGAVPENAVVAALRLMPEVAKTKDETCLPLGQI